MKALTLLAVLAAAACDRGGTTSPAAAHPGLVGAKVCEECHAAETAKWRQSDHHRAMAPADPANVVGDFGGTSFEYHGVTSKFTRADGKYVVTTDGPDGASRDFDVAYAFGFE